LKTKRNHGHDAKGDQKEGGVAHRTVEEQMPPNF